MTITITRTPVREVYAATNINAVIFRQSALVSWEDWQYCAFYAPDEAIMAGRRRIGGTAWEWERIPHHGDVRNDHNAISIGVSSDGRLHISYDHHCHPLRYRTSEGPGSIRFGLERLMTGLRESRVTYPQFINSPDGRFNDESGIPQIVHMHLEGASWRTHYVTSGGEPFTLEEFPRGHDILLKHPLSRPDVVVARNGTVGVVYRDTRAGGRVQLSCADAPDYTDWQTHELTDFPVGHWEPNYDPIAWRERQELNIWVHACGEGYPERGAGGGPQLAYVVTAELGV